MSEVPVRVALVDDDPDVRHSLSVLLGASREVALAGTYPTAEAMLEAVTAGLDARVVLADLGLPGISGVELIKRLKQLRPSIDVVVLSVFDDDENVFAALRAGASGYLLKDTPSVELAVRILEVARGGAVISPSIALRVLKEFRGPSPGENPLTAREVEVLELLVRGATYAMIGRTLEISVNTVQAHIRAIYRKLEVSTKSEAAAEAFKRRILTTR